MAAKSPEKEQASILIVEDNPDVQESLAMVLAVTGYDVACVSNGREALDYLQRHSRPDVILLDIRMPVMDGWEFMTRQQQDARLSQIPVVVMSGYVDQKEIAKQSPGTLYLTKPVNVDALRAAIQQSCP
jgi:CheY-like chemotaxis protein